MVYDLLSLIALISFRRSFVEVSEKKEFNESFEIVTSLLKVFEQSPKPEMVVTISRTALQTLNISVLKTNLFSKFLLLLNSYHFATPPILIQVIQNEAA